MACIAIGADVSKGRVDVAIINESKTLLFAGAFDDTVRGHERLRLDLAEVRRRHPGAVVVGLEATAGLERNWIGLFRALGNDVRVHRLNPMSVKRWLSADLHRSVTDASAAVGIAQFVLANRRDTQPRDDQPTAAVVLYRALRSVILRHVQVAQQLQALLPQVQPELVQFCRGRIPGWIVDLLDHYPTADRLARARIAAVAKIPYIVEVRAAALVAAARTSVATLTGPAAESAVRLLVQQWRELDRTIQQTKATLCRLAQEDPLHQRQIKRMVTVPGIGEWTAVILSLEIGDFARFESVRSLVSWTGLDPHEDQSGDGVIRRGISHRGNGQVRRALFMAAFSASLHNADVRRLWQRLESHGKPKLVAAVAAMHKLLRIAFAVVRTDRDFDPEHEAKRQRVAPPRAAASIPQAAAEIDLSAPVTARELARRKAAATRQAAAAGAADVQGQSPNAGPAASRGDSIAAATARPASRAQRRSTPSKGSSTGP